MNILSKLTVLSLVALAACGGGGGDEALPDYSGTWDVLYNRIPSEEVQSCFAMGLVAANVPGFTDLQTVAQEGTAVHVASEAGLIVADGSVGPDGVLQAEYTATGDIFEIGIMCTETRTLTYQDLSDNAAQSLFHMSIVCDDGWVCEDQVAGNAARRVTE